MDMTDKQTAMLLAYLAAIEESLRTIAEAVKRAEEAARDE